MCWWAVSDRGRDWVEAHPDLSESAPEGVECLARVGSPLIERALRSGLRVMAGDVEVTLCQ